MKRGLLKAMMVCFAIMCMLRMDAQTNQWTWMKGDSVAAMKGIYGTRGISAPGNKPGARNPDISWTDSSGTLWLYGGYGKGAGSGYGGLNDLWKYNVSSNEWTWVKGDSLYDKSGRWGTMGVASPDNKPNGRSSAVGWNTAGYFWVFGGYNSGHYNDMWRYNPQTNEWAWVKGDSTPNKYAIYGSKGVSSLANIPGSRGAGATWSDGADLWMFGGYGYSKQGYQYHAYLHDMWKYNSLTNEWTWMSGDSTVYGTGIYSGPGEHHPSPREGAAFWKDTSGNFWLFGGGAGSFKHYNDLWKFEPALNKWTWVNGDSTANVAGIYGNRGIASPSTKPGSRELATTWVDKAGDLWLFAGVGYQPTPPSSTLRFNDLWKYNIASNEWTWMKGDSIATHRAVFGTLGVPSAANNPASKNSGAGWVDTSGTLWLFGGNSYFGPSSDWCNDLWKYVPDTSRSTLPLHLLTFTAHLSRQRAASSEQNAIVNLCWTAENEINFDHYEIERSTNGRDFVAVGTVRAANSREYSYDDNVGGLSSVVGGRLYYRLKMIDKDGSFTYSKVESISFNTQHSAFSITPNPATTSIQLHFNNISNSKADVQVSDVAGKVLVGGQWSVVGGRLSIQTTNLAPGTYVVKVIMDGDVWSEKVVVQ